MRRLRGHLDLLVAILLVGSVLGPLLWGRGFVLVGDMVFVPDQPWKQAWIGGDGGVPRAVPSDAWVSLVDEVLPGDLLQRLLLVAIVGGAAWGMSRLLDQLPALARVAGMVLYVWNPYVYERLAIGHWALLCGYAALPFAVRAAITLRAGRTPAPEAERGAEVARSVGTGRPCWSSWSALAASLAVAGWTSPTGGVVVWGSALVLLWGRRRAWAGALVLGAWVNLPWIVPAVANQADQLPADPFGVEAFAARSDTYLGTWGSLATFGGIWKESIVPDARGDVLLVSVALLVLLCALGGLALRWGWGALPLPRLVALGVGSLLLAGLSAMPSARPVMEWLVTSVPGGGLLRDSQKLVAPWVLVVCVGLALAVDAVVERRDRYGAHVVFWAVGLTVLPVLALPSLAWGLGGFVSTTQYPREWVSLQRQVEALDVGEDRVLVLPFSTYRRFSWNERAVLDPVPRFFPGQMVTEDGLDVDGGRVGGESRLALSVAQARDPERLAAVLAAHDVRWLVVHAGAGEAVLPAGAVPVAQEGELSWLSVGEGGPRARGWSRRALVYAGIDLAVLLSVAGMLILSAWRCGISVTRRRHAYTGRTRN